MEHLQAEGVALLCSGGAAGLLGGGGVLRGLHGQGSLQERAALLGVMGEVWGDGHAKWRKDHPWAGEVEDRVEHRGWGKAVGAEGGGVGVGAAATVQPSTHQPAQDSVGDAVGCHGVEVEGDGAGLACRGSAIRWVEAG
jgi:hypothetical protein